MQKTMQRSTLNTVWVSKRTSEEVLKRKYRGMQWIKDQIGYIRMAIIFQDLFEYLPNYYVYLLRHSP